MPEVSLTLYIDLEQGARVDLDAAARAAIAWSKLIKTVGQHVDPFSDWEVELESALPGSQKLRSIIKLPDKADRRRVILTAIGVALGFLLKEAASWGVGEIMDYITGPDAPVEVRALSDEEVKALAEELVVILHSGTGKAEAKDVYDALEDDPDVRGAGATSAPDKRPNLVVPRSNFPSQLPEIEASEEPRERVTVETMEAVLLRPLLTASTTRRWGFQTRGGSFGAPIHDTKFLEDLLAGRMNVPLRQGIVMVIEVEVTEELVEGVWRIKDRAVKRVVSVSMPPVQRDLFGASEQDQTDEDD